MLRGLFVFIRAGIKEAVIGGVSDAIEEIDQRADAGLSVIDETSTPRIPPTGNGRGKPKARVKT